MLQATAIALATSSLVACRRASSAAQERCPHCGMLVDPKSAFRVELVRDGKVAGYDTPRCALAALRSGAPGASLRVQEFYTRNVSSAEDVRFVAGSDVEGPMGAELVPVSPAKVEKFMSDHRGARAYRLDEISLEILKKEGAP